MWVGSLCRKQESGIYSRCKVARSSVHFLRISFLFLSVDQGGYKYNTSSLGANGQFALPVVRNLLQEAETIAQVIRV